MSIVKTAVSLPEPLFERAERTAKEMNVSRSRLVAIAIEDFIRKREGRKMIDDINAAYASMTEDDERALHEMQQLSARTLSREEW